MSMMIRLDQLAAHLQAAYHCDAAEALVFARELLKIRAGMFEEKFPEFQAMSLVPMAPGLTNTTEEHTYQMVKEYASVKPTSSYAGNAPRADVSFTEATPKRIKGMRLAYGYDIQEARIAAATGNGMPMRKAKAARRGIAQEHERILTYGDDGSTYGVAMEGLANASGVATYSTPNGASGTATWATKTPDEILKDLNSMVRQMVVDTKGVERPNTLLLSLNCHEIISSTRLGDGSDTTILRHFLANQKGMTVEPWFALDSASDPAGLWTGDRAIMYRKDPEVLEGLVPVEFEQFAPQMVALETVTDCQGRFGGIVLYRPKAVMYADGL